MRVSLLGDSIFDSRRHMQGRPDMAERVRSRLRECPVDLLAASGSRLSAMAGQTARLTPGATHAVASIGGNDLLDIGMKLHASRAGLTAAVSHLHDFQRRYGSFCDGLRATGLRSAVCTIYTPPLRDPFLQMVGTAAIQMANAAIAEEARRHGLAIIDLGRVCHRAEDFIDPIHPSDAGADKIAAAIADWIMSEEAINPRPS